MNPGPYFSDTVTDMRAAPGKPLRTRGCIIMICLEGFSVIECNFSRRTFRRGDMAVMFSDTLFSVEKVSRSFSVRKFELSVELCDEATFISTSDFFDWLAANPVVTLSDEGLDRMHDFFRLIDSIGSECSPVFRHTMLRNSWQNFFIMFESAVKPLLDRNEIRTISSPRRLFNRFCQLLCENCRTRHDVKFYADSLCITPYYLSRITYLVFKVSPKELIDRQLMMELKAMLSSTDLSVKEIADRYHFESASYMSRYFRRHAGMSPLEYRHRQ